jgi:hypothetical protein
MDFIPNRLTIEASWKDDHGRAIFLIIIWTPKVKVLIIFWQFWNIESSSPFPVSHCNSFKFPLSKEDYFLLNKLSNLSLFIKSLKQKRKKFFYCLCSCMNNNWHFETKFSKKLVSTPTSITIYTSTTLKLVVLILNYFYKYKKKAWKNTITCA